MIPSTRSATLPSAALLDLAGSNRVTVEQDLRSGRDEDAIVRTLYVVHDSRRDRLARRIVPGIQRIVEGCRNLVPTGSTLAARARRSESDPRRR